MVREVIRGGILMSYERKREGRGGRKGLLQR